MSADGVGELARFWAKVLKGPAPDHLDTLNRPTFCGQEYFGNPH
jgi:hypothetical protein